MKGEILGSAAVLAIGLAAYGYLTTPRHAMTRLDEYTAFKLDRWNGDLQRCTIYEDGDSYCTQLPEFEEIDPKVPGERSEANQTENGIKTGNAD